MIDRITIRRAQLDEIVALRHAVLRPGLPRDTAQFKGDDAIDTLHFGAFAAEGQAVACLTLVRNDQNSVPAFQLRGMATASTHRGQNLGADLLRFAEAFVQQHTQVRQLWCNARSEALGFYAKQGWRTISEEFHVETVGPHYRMMKLLA